MRPILRPSYLAAVEPYVDQPFVKVLTGLRRSGKSTLLALIAQRLEERGVRPDHVLRFDFEALDLLPLTGAEALNAHVTGLLVDTERYYLLLDEIQEVDGWEKVVNSLIATRNVDIYVTGSNSRLLSSELATYIAGRYVTIEVSTLSFAEHVAFVTQFDPQSAASTADHFDDYLRRGGFPGLYAGSFTDAQLYQVVEDIYASALIRDTISRRNIRNVDMLQRVATFALDNVGNPFSARSVVDFFKSQRRKVDTETVLSYLDAMTESFVLTRIPRYDIAGRKLLTVNEKYYAGDHSLIHAMLGYSDRHLPGVLENIVQAELRRRGNRVVVGKADGREVDFIAERGDDRTYVQVTTTMTSDRTRERELAPLLAIRDSHPKIVLSLDRHAGGNEAGIKHRYLPDWLLDT